jgi:DNA-binding XRE family transcriptional regulator
MRIQGTVQKDGKYWLISIPIADLDTQSTTKSDAYAMAKDVIEQMVGESEFHVKITPLGAEDFLISTDNEKNSKLLVGLILKRNRERAHLTMAQVAKRMKVSSINSYSQYEQGKTLPSVDKFFEILHAINKNFEPVLTLLRA